MNIKINNSGNLLKSFTDSPDSGDKNCLCSYCNIMIDAGEAPLRVWSGKGKATMEMRFHDACMKSLIGLGIIELVK